MAERAISLPMSLSPYGTIQATQSQSKIWSDRVLSVIGTLQSERVMFPEFGTNIASALFKGTDTAVQEIDAEIQEAFVNLLPNLTYIESIIEEDVENGTIVVDVVYSLPNQEVQKTAVALTAIGGKNPPAQENL